MVRKPANIPHDADQLRPPIVRSKGSTPSERYLAHLGDRTFLNLWSYPNPYREQKQGGRGDGKELCDLLVVCDPHVIVFSEKAIVWPDRDIDVAWGRWFRKAVLEAANQLKGAERWINEFPERIFLDKDCNTPFPLQLPDKDRRRFHRVVVARGAAQACRKHFGEDIGTFMIKPVITGLDHCNPKAAEYSPFTIGDLDPSGDYVHVFDETALDVVISELDTITDFTDYLDKRASFLRSGRVLWCHGEEELLAYYAVRINEAGDHDFTPPEGEDWTNIDGIAIGRGGYEALRKNPRYLAKKQEDSISYAWDRLIEVFTRHMMGGTSIVLPGHSYSLLESEVAVRYMALQSRFLRRGLSKALLDALEMGKTTDKFFRLILPSEGSKGSETAFFIMTLKYLDFMDREGGYARYRQYRAFFLKTYAQAVLMKYPRLARVIGIAMEPPNQGRGSSEDIIYGAQHDWSDEDRRQLQDDCDALGIMNGLKERPYTGDEFPHVADRRGGAVVGNRKQRRAQAAMMRREKR